MIKDFINQKLTPATLTALFKAAFLGILSAEAYYLSQVVVLRLKPHIIDRDYEQTAIIIAGVCILIVALYLYVRGFFTKIIILLESKRLDTLIAYCFGMLISASFNGIGMWLYGKIVSALTIEQLLVLCGLPLLASLLFMLQGIIARLSERNFEPSFFVSDQEMKSKTDDLLGFSEDADRFAERVYNQGSPESIVFGIDAPWGIGKSSFINLCKEYWEIKYPRKVVIYTFNPPRYEDRTNLLEKFIDGLVRTIQKYSFLPEIKPLFSKYARFIKATKGGFSFSGLSLEVVLGTYTIDDALDDLELVLSDYDKKIIIVIDDLDRLHFSAIKDVLFAVKKSFTLPNISYVLCYDTDNIKLLEGQQNADTDKILEFLEKFINVKISLYLDGNDLTDYVSNNLDKVLSGNSQADPILISKAVGGLIDVYKSEDFHQYLPFIGDIRKIKRLINTLLLLEVEKTDFENSDFDKYDLIHLLLIYINAPNVFRKIYNTETNGKRGFFSVVWPHEDGYPDEQNNSGERSRFGDGHYANSKQYTKYVGSLSPNEKFLVEQTFNVKQRLKETRIDSISQDIKNSYACFNGDGGWTGGRNLEEYLNLIVKLSKPQKENQHKFYLNCRDRIAKGESIKSVLQDEVFAFSQSENPHQLFWRTIMNSFRQFTPAIASKLINYLIVNLPVYSLFTNEKIGVGLRDDLDMFLIKMLDEGGWQDENGEHSNNSEDNIAEIAEWIFGEGRHTNEGILNRLSAPDRGVMGLYDLLAFRLFCSTDRGGDIFNLSRSLSKHGSPHAPTEGSVQNIVVEEMREISQKVFGIFKSQYIQPNQNLFDLIDELSLDNFGGKYKEYIESKIASGDVEDPDATIAALKTRMKSFITYQLGNSIISSGIGCGYYDESANEDINGIKVSFVDYLFNVCFNPELNENNYQHFLDYLLINFASIFGRKKGRDYVPNIEEFAKVIGKEKLAEYWKAHGEKIKALNLHNTDKQVNAGNYIASYKDDLPEVYQLLDELVLEIDSASTTPPEMEESPASQNILPDHIA